MADPPAPPVFDAVPPEVVELPDPVVDPVVALDPPDGDAPPVCALDPPVPDPVVEPVLPLPVELDEPLPPEEDDEVSVLEVPPVPLLPALLPLPPVESVEVVDVVSVCVVAVVPVWLVDAPPLAARADDPVGVVTSGIVRGTASETCVPPQAPRTTPLSRAPSTAAGRTARATLGRPTRPTTSRGGPCAGRRSGSR